MSSRLGTRLIRNLGSDHTDMTAAATSVGSHITGMTRK